MGYNKVPVAVHIPSGSAGKRSHIAVIATSLWARCL